MWAGSIYANYCDETYSVITPLSAIILCSADHKVKDWSHWSTKGGSGSTGELTLS